MLILPDLHLQWEAAQKIIDFVGADDIIFLGDFFDDFNDDPESVNEMCDWLENSVKQPNRIHLFGNHDCHYAFPAEHWRCSGYTQWKHFIVRDRIDHTVWNKFKFYHILDNTWLLSHGGLHKSNLPENIANLHTNRPAFLKEISNYLDNEIIEGHRQNSWIFCAGHSRGGFQRVGGITWCDHNKEMLPITGLSQIYGHSPQQHGSASWLIQDSNDSQPYFELSSNWTPTKKQTKTTNTTYNLCLDVWKNMHYAIWDGSTLSINKLADIV